MFYYEYNPLTYKITKEVTSLEESNVSFCEEQFDLNSYDVTIGYLSDEKEILKYTKKIKGDYVLMNKLEELIKKLENEKIEKALSEIEIDERISILEMTLL